ncbi:hypothetical protein MBANPS3_004247 [Mucor bainieri]
MHTALRRKCSGLSFIYRDSLLSGGGDGKVHVFDLQAMPANHMRNEPIASTARVDRHKYAVTSVSWFPFDTGMFVTSSYDTTIKVWDTNEMKASRS